MPPVRFGVFEAGQRREHLLDVGRAGLLHRLHPQVEADVVRFHRIVGRALRVLDVGLPLLDERLVRRRADALEVVPGRQVADERLGVEARELLFADREGDDRDVLGRDLLVAELLVERHVGVAVDRRDDRRLLAGRAEALDRRDARLPVGVAERRVVDRDVGRPRRPSPAGRPRGSCWSCAGRRSRCLRAPTASRRRPSSGSRPPESPADSARRRCR